MCAAEAASRSEEYFVFGAPSARKWAFPSEDAWRDEAFGARFFRPIPLV